MLVFKLLILKVNGEIILTEVLVQVGGRLSHLIILIPGSFCTCGAYYFHFLFLFLLNHPILYKSKLSTSNHLSFAIITFGNELC